MTGKRGVRVQTPEDAGRRADLRPDAVLILGDTNSSMAAIAAYPELSCTKDTAIKVNPGSSFSEWYGNGTFKNRRIEYVEKYVDLK